MGEHSEQELYNGNIDAGKFIKQSKQLGETLFFNNLIKDKSILKDKKLFLQKLKDTLLPGTSKSIKNPIHMDTMLGNLLIGEDFTTIQKDIENYTGAYLIKASSIMDLYSCLCFPNIGNHNQNYENFKGNIEIRRFNVDIKQCLLDLGWIILKDGEQLHPYDVYNKKGEKVYSATNIKELLTEDQMNILIRALECERNCSVSFGSNISFGILYEAFRKN